MNLDINKLTENLNNNDKNILIEYLDLEKKNISTKSKEILSKFILNLKKYDNNIIENFVDYLLEIVLYDNKVISNNYRDSSCGFIIRHNLLKEIIHPVILKKIKMGSSIHYRYLFLLHQYYLSENKIMSDIISDTKEDFCIYTLQKSIEMDHNAIISVELLKEYLFNLFKLYIHELPYGIFVKSEVFNSNILLMQSLLSKYNGNNLENEKLIRYRNILDSWNNYVSKIKLYKSFQEYIVNNNLEYLIYEKK